MRHTRKLNAKNAERQEAQRVKHRQHIDFPFFSLRPLCLCGEKLVNVVVI